MSNNTNANNTLNLAGMVWAGILSWAKWHSLGWAIVHTLFGWFYVIYYFIRY